jgi:acyl-CoA synthetase (AMP-forming)/AMP-acid ligase II
VRSLVPTGLEQRAKEAREELRVSWRASGLYSGRTIFQEMDAVARTYPDATLTYRYDAFPGDEVTLTLTEIRQRAMGVAASLADLGLSAGDAIAIQLPNWPEMIVSYYAAVALGLVLVPVVDIYGSAELSYILEESRARAMLMAASWRHRSFRERIGDVDTRWLEHRIVVGEADAPDVISWSALEKAGAGRAVRPAALRPADPILLLYTSGSTALPKGVVHSHESILAEQQVSPLRPLGGPRSERYLLSSPPGHIAGFLSVLRAIVQGCDAVLLDMWNPAVAREVVEEHRLTASGGTFQMQTLLEEFDKSGHPIPRMIWSVGGSAVPPRVVEWADDKGWAAWRAYGSSEHPTVSGSTPAAPLRVRAETDGPPCRGSEVRIVDDVGKDVGQGQDGLILCRGPEQFLGYAEPSLNASAFVGEGWFDTGDVGRIDAEGNLVVTGRIKDIIIRGGENISAREVEEALQRFPAVADAAVVPYPDPRYGERVAAFVVVRDGGSIALEELAPFFTELGMAKQKAPERLTVLDQLPRNEAGKVDKRSLRRMLGAPEG